MYRAGLPRMVGTGLALMLFASAQGCASISGGPASLSSLLSSEPATEPPADGPKISVVVRAPDKKPRMVEIPYQDEMLVQDALDQSGASRQFRRMKIRLVRKNPQRGVEEVLGVECDNISGRVPESSNYALRDGDRVIVEKEDVTVVEEALDTVFGPLRRITRR